MLIRMGLALKAYDGAIGSGSRICDGMVGMSIE